MPIDLKRLMMEEWEALARLAAARDGVCRTCRYYFWHSQPGWRWSRCWRMGTDAEGVPNVELTSELRKGPEDTCPEGKWAGVVGMTQEEADAQAALKLRETAEKWWEDHAPFVARFSGKAVLFEALDEAVAGGLMTGAKAQEIKKLADA